MRSWQVNRKKGRLPRLRVCKKQAFVVKAIEFLIQNWGKIMGRLVVNAAEIQDFRVEKITEDDGGLVAHMTIYTDGAEFTKYRIAGDDYNRALDVIIENLRGALLTAKTGGDFQVREDSERSYLHITYPNGKISERYAGQRLALFEKSRD